MDFFFLWLFIMFIVFIIQESWNPGIFRNFKILLMMFLNYVLFRCYCSLMLILCPVNFIQRKKIVWSKIISRRCIVVSRVIFGIPLHILTVYLSETEGALPCFGVLSEEKNNLVHKNRKKLSIPGPFRRFSTRMC